VNDLVFCTGIGTPMDASVLWRNFKRLLVKAELPSIRFHDLRHSAASLLLNEGVPMKVISELLGRSSIRVTADINSHLTRATMDETAASMDRILA
jgi:integrase